MVCEPFQHCWWAIETARIQVIGNDLAALIWLGQVDPPALRKGSRPSGHLVGRATAAGPDDQAGRGFSEAQPVGWLETFPTGILDLIEPNHYRGHGLN